MSRSLSILLIVFSISWMTSCGPGTEENSETRFRINLAGGLSSLDPAYASNQAKTWLANQLFNGLVQFNDSLNVKPCIANSWSIENNGTRYVFNLRNDVFFHDSEVFENKKGRKVIASDFVYSFNRLLSTGTGGWVFRDKIIEEDAFTAPNDSTFVLELKQSFAPMLGLLAMQYCSVVPQEAVEFYGQDFMRNPVGTGPFRFKFWSEGDVLIIEKNPSYFEFEGEQRLPYLQEVQVNFNSNKSAEFLSLQNGDLDYVSDLDASLRNQVLTPSGDLQQRYMDEGLVLRRHPYFNTEYLAILVDEYNPLVADSEIRKTGVRQAMNYGINREDLVLYINRGKGLPAHAGMTPPGLPSYSDTAVKGYNYDPRMARKLLLEAEYDDTNPIKLTCDPQYKDMCSFIVRQLSEIGMNVELEVVDEHLIKEIRAEGKIALFRASWIGDYPDGENYMTLFYGKNAAPPNYTRFYNKEFDQLYERAMGETNDSARFVLYHRMENIVMEEAPVIPVFYDEVYQFTRNNVSGLSLNAMNLLDLKRTKKN